MHKPRKTKIPKHATPSHPPIYLIGKKQSRAFTTEQDCPVSQCGGTGNRKHSAGNTQPPGKDKNGGKQQKATFHLTRFSYSPTDN